MTRTALITGITGQDGAYLAESLLDKGYTVHGIKRRTSLFNTDRVDHLYADHHERGVRFLMRYGDMTEATNLIRMIQETQPDEVYNLAAHWLSAAAQYVPHLLSTAGTVWRSSLRSRLRLQPVTYT